MAEFLVHQESSKIPPGSWSVHFRRSRSRQICTYAVVLRFDFEYLSLSYRRPYSSLLVLPVHESNRDFCNFVQGNTLLMSYSLDDVNSQKFSGNYVNPFETSARIWPLVVLQRHSHVCGQLQLLDMPPQIRRLQARAKFIRSRRFGDDRKCLTKISVEQYQSSTKSS